MFPWVKQINSFKFKHQFQSRIKRVRNLLANMWIQVELRFHHLVKLKDIHKHRNKHNNNNSNNNLRLSQLNLIKFLFKRIKKNSYPELNHEFMPELAQNIQSWELLRSLSHSIQSMNNSMRRSVIHKFMRNILKTTHCALKIEQGF